MLGLTAETLRANQPRAIWACSVAERPSEKTDGNLPVTLGSGKCREAASAIPKDWPDKAASRAVPLQDRAAKLK
jgi:hypothetical protein